MTVPPPFVVFRSSYDLLCALPKTGLPALLLDRPGVITSLCTISHFVPTAMRVTVTTVGLGRDRDLDVVFAAGR